jgi:hypothetical protein
VDKRSGVSQRLPITTLELVVSNAERRALAAGETIVVPRVTDIYAALPSITGKFELEYEGELRGAEQVARDLIRSSVGSVFTGIFEGVETTSKAHRLMDLGCDALQGFLYSRPVRAEGLPYVVNSMWKQSEEVLEGSAP